MACGAGANEGGAGGRWAAGGGGGGAMPREKNLTMLLMPALSPPRMLGRVGAGRAACCRSSAAAGDSGWRVKATPGTLTAAVHIAASSSDFEVNMLQFAYFTHKLAHTPPLVTGCMVYSVHYMFTLCVYQTCNRLLASPGLDLKARKRDID